MLILAGLQIGLPFFQVKPEGTISKIMAPRGVLLAVENVRCVRPYIRPGNMHALATPLKYVN